MSSAKSQLKKPPWLKRRMASTDKCQNIRKLLNSARLHTVCEAAGCPNMDECFSRNSATLLILGDRCTRNCRFCAVPQGPSGPLDPQEPQKVAEIIGILDLDYAVITSVTRDDLPDGGAGHFAATIHAIRKMLPQTRIEVLIPDFLGEKTALETVVHAHPDVLNHNIETVPRLYPTVRPGADYLRSLNLLDRVRALKADLPTKSGLMLGLGETREEIQQVFADLLRVDCRMLTLGQYLQPSKAQLSVERYVSPEEFEQLRSLALKMGFLQVASGPFVRSSYNAAGLFEAYLFQGSGIFSPETL